jgi:RNA polymerase sigma-70 factor (ECF subfamily)
METPSSMAGPSRDRDAENETDIRLMTETANGNPDAFSELVRRHQGPLMNFFRRTGVSTEAEDLAQQAFLRLYRYRNRYRPTARFTTFLYLVARQVRTDALRRRKRAADLVAGMANMEFANEGPSSAQDEATARMEEALRKLPGRMRDVVVLGILQGLGYEEIGAVLRIPVGTVKSRMFNALRRMRAEMRENRS